MQISVRLERIFIGMALILFGFVSTAHAADATVIAEVAQPMGSE